MSGCCDHDTEFDGTSPAFRRALWIVIAINAGLFVVEMLAGAAAHSQALKADALDFAADAATYSLSLFVIGKPALWRANAALLKAASLFVMGALILALALYRAFVSTEPDAGLMGGIALLALAANLASVLILVRWRNGDANVRSVWLCSRNDAIGNIAVFASAGLVAWSGTHWPDVIVAGLMAGLFVSSAVQILGKALHERRHARTACSPSGHSHDEPCQTG
ncbi:cation transporter [Maricaulis parjimensis]|uniref:cation transporter n=1 Tax=Maricaulis parjimensis TaxID=144023 RepID=UPI00193A8775